MRSTIEVEGNGRPICLKRDPLLATLCPCFLDFCDTETVQPQAIFNIAWAVLHLKEYQIVFAFPREILDPRLIFEYAPIISLQSSQCLSWSYSIRHNTCPVLVTVTSCQSYTASLLTGDTASGSRDYGISWTRKERTETIMKPGCTQILHIAFTKPTLTFARYGRFPRLAHTTDNVLNNLASDNRTCNRSWNTNISIRQHRRTSLHQIRRPRARLVKCLS